MVDSGAGLDPFTVPLHRPNDRQFPCSEGCTRGMSVVLVKKTLEFPTVSGAHNALQLTQNAMYARLPSIYFQTSQSKLVRLAHDDVIKLKHFPRYWPFMRGIHRSPVKSPYKASDAELWCFLWVAPEPTDEQTMGTPVISNAIALIVTSL